MKSGLVLFLLIIGMQSAAAAEPKVVVNMRDSGYTMGDLMEMQVHITLPKNQHLDPDSLPLEGRVKPWLDLRKLSMQANDEKIKLSFTWQLFATVEIAQALKLPEIVLKTLPIQGKAQVITIPAQAFQYSPVFAYPIGKHQRRADLPPIKFDEKTPLSIALASFTLAILLGLLWAWTQDLLAWLPHKPGPLTQLARQLKRQQLQTLQTQDLQHIHAALNATAGVTLYPNNLVVLFEKASYLLPQQLAISQFFNASWQQFYGHQSAVHTISGSIDKNATLVWVNQAALSERLFRRKTSHQTSKIAPKRKLATAFIA
ncbi:MAG: hypothetical protein CTY37_00720 [Methylotenera sp.]|nr:MAG: hypothetical protein CTY37_00720 [Methylotenera sp.]